MHAKREFGHVYNGFLVSDFDYLCQAKRDFTCVCGEKIDLICL